MPRLRPCLEFLGKKKPAFKDISTSPSSSKYAMPRKMARLGRLQHFKNQASTSTIFSLIALNLTNSAQRPSASLESMRHHFPVILFLCLRPGVASQLVGSARTCTCCVLAVSGTDPGVRIKSWEIACLYYSHEPWKDSEPVPVHMHLDTDRGVARAHRLSLKTLPGYFAGSSPGNIFVGSRRWLGAHTKTWLSPHFYKYLPLVGEFRIHLPNLRLLLSMPKRSGTCTRSGEGAVEAWSPMYYFFIIKP